MDIDRKRKHRLRHATAKACAALTEGMTKPELEQRLTDVRAKLKASTAADGKPLRGMAERVQACAAEIARLEALVADPS